MGSLKPVTPKQAFAQFIVEQMAGLGPVQAKAMFGGFGLYLQGLMFSLILDDTVYIKADEVSRTRFESRGLAPFRYEAKGKVSSLKYFQAPPEAYDDPHAMVEWARLGHEAAVRQQSKQGAKRARAAATPAHPHDLDGADLPNLGPKSREMLKRAGFAGVQSLREAGSVVAYVRTRAIWPQASLNLLWALEGALSGRSWQEVAQTDRATLLMALEDIERQWASDAS